MKYFSESKAVQYPVNSIWFFSVSAVLSYCLVVFYLSRFNSTSFNELSIFELSALPNLFLIPVRLLIVIISGVCFLSIGSIWCPLFKDKFENIFHYFSFSFVVAIFMTICSCVIFKIVLPFSIDRTIFLGILATLLITGLFFLKYKKICYVTINTKPNKNKILLYLVGLVIFFTVTFSLFSEKYLYEGQNYDGYETYGLILSLADNAFPVMNFHPSDPLYRGDGKIYVAFGLMGEQGIITTYVEYFSFMFLGKSPTVLKLLYLPIITLLLLILVLIINTNGFKHQLFVFLSIANQLLLYTVVMFFYTANNNFFVDVSTDPLMQTFFTVILMWMIYFFVKGEKDLVILFGILLFFTTIAGFVFLALFLLFYWWVFLRHEKLKKYYLKYSGILMSIICIVSVLVLLKDNEYVQFYYENMRMEIIDDYISRNTASDIFIFIKYFIIFSGSFGIFCLPFLKFWKEKNIYFLTLIMIGYLVFVLAGGHKNLHYFAPVSLFPILILLLILSKRHKEKLIIMAVLCMISSSVLIKLSWPKVYYVENYLKKYSERVCYLFSSEDDIPIGIKKFFEIQKLYKYAYIFDQSWILGASITTHPKEGCEYYFTDNSNPPAPNTKLAFSNGGYYFWANDDLRTKIKEIPVRKDIYSNLFSEISGDNW